MLITIVIPVFNEEKNVAEMYARLKTVEEKLENVRLDILYVNDASTDNTLNEIKRLVETDANVGYLSFIRNYGHQAAMVAGMTESKGDAVITLDGDLQHPPENIAEMVAAFSSGAEVVQMVRRKASSNLVGRISKIYHSLLHFLDNSIVVLNGADYRLISRRVIEEIQTMPEKNKFLRALLPLLGFRTVILYFDEQPRNAGKSSYSFSQLLELAVNPLFKYSSLTIKMIAFFGFFLVLSGMIVLASMFFSLFSGNGILPGTQVNVFGFSSFLLILFGILFIALSILGKFLLEVLAQLQGRPGYVIESVVYPKDS